MSIIPRKVCLETVGRPWASTSALSASFVKWCQRANNNSPTGPQVLGPLKFSLHGIFNGGEENLPGRKVSLKDNTELRRSVLFCEASLREVPQGWRVSCWALR